jgi:hypothetical protein
LPDKLLIDLEALLSQSVADRLWRGLQAQAVRGISDRLFLAGRAHGYLFPGTGLALLAVQVGAVVRDLSQVAS